MALILHIFAFLLVWTADGQKCPPDWISPPDKVSCYKVVEEALSWYDSRDHCQQLGGHLVILNSEEEQEWITSQIADNTFSDDWAIGLCRRENGTWAWVDGTIMTVLELHDPQKGKHVCALYYRESQDIIDAGCDSSVINFACETERGSGSPCPDFWVKRSDSLSCYLLFEHNPVIWYKAREYCQDKGGDLVVINSQQEKDWLSMAMKNFNNLEIWIGLSEKDGIWRWTDGTSLDTSILSWREGSPRAGKSYGNVKFVYMSVGGRFRSTPLQLEVGFICEISEAPYTIACDAPPVSENQEVICVTPDGTSVQCHHNLHVPGSIAAYRSFKCQ